MLVLRRQTLETLNDLISTALEISNERNETLVTQLTSLNEMLNKALFSFRFSVSVTPVEIVPETTDLILNYIVKELLVLLDEEDVVGSKRYIELENAIWQYLNDVHNFDPEQHHLLNHTTEEALTYAFNHIGIVE